MPDYSSWLVRAEAFVREAGTAFQWSLNIDIAPPLSAAEAESLSNSLPFGLPGFLRDFYCTASAAAECRFGWEPAESQLPALNEILPHERGLYGGVSICAAGQLPEQQNYMCGFADALEDLGRYGPPAAKVLRESVPLIPIRNGDYIIWHATAAAEQPRVLYISHEADLEEESAIIPLALDGEEFFAAWEAIGYIGPEIWLLGPFLEDSPDRLLDGNSPLAGRWRSYLRSNQFPI